MPNQIYKIIPPKELIYDFLKKSAHIEDKYYIFSKTYYKSATIKKLIQPFLNNIRKYYHSSKCFYIDRMHTYKSFATILRQICRANEIPIHSVIKYFKSSYIIQYKILII